MSKEKIIFSNDATLEEKKIFSSLTNVFKLQGKIYRYVRSRKTFRFEHNEHAYYIKIHTGIGIKEIIKNILQLRWPIISARTEWNSLCLLEKLNIFTTHPIALGECGINPAYKKSFLITRELKHIISLESLCAQWQTVQPYFPFKIALIEQVAEIASLLHKNGINHRDFYLCHFLLDTQQLCENKIKLYLIDLHRAQIRQQIPQRWLMKDLSGLLFSALDTHLTQRDLFRFLRAYRKKPLRILLNEEKSFWQNVKHQADKLYHKIHGTNINVAN